MRGRRVLGELLRRHRMLAYATGGFGLSINAITYLLVPLRAHELGAGLAVIGLLVGTKALAETVLSVPLGAFIDRTGPRRSMLVGLGGTALVGVGFMIAPSIALLFVFQVLLGLFRPLAWLGGQSYAAGMRGGDSRAYDTGRFSFVANLGQIVTPVVAGGLAGLWGTRAGFGVIVVLGVGFFGVVLALPDAARSARAGSKGAGFGTAGRLLAVPGVQIVMLLTFCRLWIPAVWSSFFPLYLVSSGADPATGGGAIAAMGLAATLTSLATGWIARQGSAVAVTTFGLAVSLVGVGVSPLTDAAPWAFLPAMLVGFGQGLSLPMLITLTSQAVPADVRSLALGLRSGVNQAAATLAPTIIGPLIGAAGVFVGFPSAAVVGGGFLVAAVVVSRRVPLGVRADE